MTLLNAVDTKTLEEITQPRERRKVKGLISTDYLPKFEHVNARTIEEAAFLLKSHEGKAALIAGGTELLRELKSRVHPRQPEILVNIKSISKPKLSYIEGDVTGLKIGCLATLHDVELEELIRGKYGMLAQTAHMSGAPQYRNMATLGGDLCQQARCWYYRASGNYFFCYRKGGNKCFASDGDNRYHAVFGGKGCFAVCPSDMASALVALGAKVKIFGISEDKIVPLERFFTSTGNILEPGEILTEIQVPAPTPQNRGIFMKIGLRNEFDPALVTVAVVATVDDGVCNSIRVVLGGVSPIPWRVTKVEDMLIGRRFSQDTVEAAVRVAIEGAAPLQMNAYKLYLVEALAKRAILSLL